MNQDERIEQLTLEAGRLRERVDLLERLVDETAERQALFGRPRYMIWGTLEAELPAGGAADVQLKAKEDGSWANKWIMEDVFAPPVMPDGTCIPYINPETDSPTWVLVAWFPLDEEYYVVGAEICPTTDCSSSSSSSS